MTHTASGCGRDAVLTWLQGSSERDITSCSNKPDPITMSPKLTSCVCLNRAGFEQDIDGDQSSDTCTGE